MFDLTLKNGEKNDNLLVALEKANYSAIKKLLYRFDEYRNHLKKS